MMQRTVTRTQALIALALTALAAVAFSFRTSLVPALPLPSMSATTILAAIVVPCIAITLYSQVSMMFDPAARAAARKRADADRKNRY